VSLGHRDAHSIKKENVAYYWYYSLDEAVVRRRHALPLLRSCMKF
jgi:hypothetical protein